MQKDAQVQHTPPALPGTFDHGGDLCCGFFKQMYDAGRIPIPVDAKVLEIGCAEWDLLTPLKALRPDLHLTGVDQREHPPRPGADRLVMGNLLNASLFPADSFDVILAVSVIEHVGIGRYGHVLNEDGNSLAMAHCRRWLKPEGLMYLDVPYRPKGPSTPFRAYDPDDLQRRVIAGWHEVDRQVFEAKHPDAPYIALVLTP